MSEGLRAVMLGFGKPKVYDEDFDDDAVVSRNYRVDKNRY